jgi:hypothetical protein
MSVVVVSDNNDNEGISEHELELVAEDAAEEAAEEAIEDATEEIREELADAVEEITDAIEESQQALSADTLILNRLNEIDQKIDGLAGAVALLAVAEIAEAEQEAEQEEPLETIVMEPDTEPKTRRHGFHKSWFGDKEQ